MSASAAKISTSLPFPSSPHWEPRTTVTACKQGESHCITARDDEDGPIRRGWGQDSIARNSRSLCPDFLIRNRDSNTAGARDTTYIYGSAWHRCTRSNSYAHLRIPYREIRHDTERCATISIKEIDVHEYNLYRLYIAFLYTIGRSRNKY
jgi:hypothetical protein